MTLEKTKYIGQPLQRLEDPPLITGKGRYAADVSFHRQLHMRIVRSHVAHGRIKSIDISAATAATGVHAVWTAADIADIPPIGFREGRIERLEPFRQPVLGKDRVRYVGEPIAAVFADDQYLAEDAAELVIADIEELPPLLAADEPPREFEPGRSTEAEIVRQGYGDVDAAFKRAHTVVELDLKIGRHSGVPLETRGAIARYDAARDVLELHGAAKVPHRNQEALSRMLNRPMHGVHLYEGHVGGGFGIRGELYPEDVLVCVAALRLERPVKWIEDRHEHLIAANHSRQQRHKVRAAVAADGEIIAIDDEFFHDQGAYLRTHAIRVPHMTCGILPGPYRIPAYRAVGHVRLTNKTPAATYRAPGRYETTFVRERLIDAIAHKLGMDPVEVRRRNSITSAEMPYHRPLQALGEEIDHDSGDYMGLLDNALAKVEWPKLQAELKRRRAAGEAVGAGIALFVEKAGLGPTDGVRISVDVNGFVEVVTGGASIGQGFETVMAQICAETLGVDYKRIRVIHGQTDKIEHGIGAHASRATVMTGSATHVAATKLREKAIDVASELLQAPAEVLDVIDGRVIRRDRPDGASITLGEIAKHLSGTSKNRGEREPGLSVTGWFNSEHQVYPYGAHVAVVKVDRETGAVAIERYLAAYDIGRAVNPMLVKGQITGGFAQGLGGALFEEFRYDSRGEPLSVTFADYLMPTVRETPRIEIMLTEEAPSPRNPLGIKGAGESGITPVGAAIASAIDAAIEKPGAVTQLPVTPQRLKELLGR
jgi:carbon-monoxide dehydrogenase large subunit